ncbi:MAG: NAD(P)-dependent oxidoreductase [Armatimonadota bacterium]|nr:NAD(P)-dependent oxidoreductase [Armatimonadota bacterium]MDR7479489.1 NAD(P)-dependent oxidoreductase [Armatimonadota bacterium]MDR7526648.1 NAD(P)-dependent oxidoreductase [Armatimonadota bacterium]MDR7543917.1 NAD(P)-dependent oxidoreductase [Armatimonadota bacterium]MDR7573967.1 NAD(P)-dependent oxidoreductase [Armatimonadota bacterium]
MIVSIVGATGFIGTWLAERLHREQGCALKLVVRSCDRLPHTWREAKDVTIYEADVATAGLRLKHWLVDSDVVYHLAGSPGVWFSYQNPIADARISVLGTVNLLEALRASGHGKIVLLSTCRVYSNLYDADEDTPTEPTSPYAAGKLAAESYTQLYGRRFGLRWTILRPSWVYGPRMVKNPIYDLALGFLDRRPVRLSISADSALDFIHVRDVVEALVRASGMSWDNLIVNVSSAQSVPLREVLAMMHRKFGYVVEVEHVSNNILSARVINDLARRLGWWPIVPLEQGIGETVEALRMDPARPQNL